MGHHIINVEIKLDLNFIFNSQSYLHHRDIYFIYRINKLIEKLMNKFEIVRK
jgi:hypothetical protein